MSGTASAAFNGKSTLIPYLFDGLHPESSVTRAKTNNRWNSNTVDVICNDETSSKWVIADFHGRVESIQARNLLKAMLSVSTMHLINVTMADFDESSGEISTTSELREIVSWQLGHTTSTVVLIIRDFSSAHRSKLDLIKDKLARHFDSRQVILLTLENISDEKDASRPFRIKNLTGKMAQVVSLLVELKPMHSIRDVEFLFENLNNNPNFDGEMERCPINIIEQRFFDLFRVFT